MQSRQTIYEVFNPETLETVYMSEEQLETYFPELKAGTLEIISEEQIEVE